MKKKSKARIKEMIPKVKTLLEDSRYLHAAEIADSIGMSVSSVSNLIRKMREHNIGVITTKNGYTLSEHATKIDDIGFMRRLLGRRASDYIAMKAAEPDIKKRWNAVEDRQMFQKVLGITYTRQNEVSAGMKALLVYSK